MEKCLKNCNLLQLIKKIKMRCVIIIGALTNSQLKINVELNTGKMKKLNQNQYSTEDLTKWVNTEKNYKRLLIKALGYTHHIEKAQDLIQDAMEIFINEEFEVQSNVPEIIIAQLIGWFSTTMYRCYLNNNRSKAQKEHNRYASEKEMDRLNNIQSNSNIEEEYISLETQIALQKLCEIAARLINFTCREMGWIEYVIQKIIKDDMLEKRLINEIGSKSPELMSYMRIISIQKKRINAKI